MALKNKFLFFLFPQKKYLGTNPDFFFLFWKKGFAEVGMTRFWKRISLISHIQWFPTSTGLCLQYTFLSWKRRQEPSQVHDKSAFYTPAGNTSWLALEVLQYFFVLLVSPIILYSCSPNWPRKKLYKTISSLALVQVDKTIGFHQPTY